MKEIKLFESFSFTENRMLYFPRSNYELFKHVVGDRLATKFELELLEPVFEAHGCKVLFEHELDPDAKIICRVEDNVLFYKQDDGSYMVENGDGVSTKPFSAFDPYNFTTNLDHLF